MAKQYAQSLRVITPHMRGQRVKDAQYLLKGNNRFKGLATYKDGKLDGEYGPLTAQATKRAKYWLGYPSTAIDGVFGQTIYEYLRTEHWRPLPKSYQDRRDSRLASVAITPCAKAFAEAEKHIGYKETPVNHTMFGKWYGLDGYPWCAMFESWCFDKTGWKRFHYAAVEQIYYSALANRNQLYIVRTPKQGDIVGYGFGGDSFAHTAFFDHWINSTTFVDLGGNTGPEDISNGGMVLKQNRSTSLVHFYARVIP